MREMVRMRYVDGRGNLEIAMRMNCDERTVKRVIREAIGIMEEE
jgi:DNA-directed RNA polymerase specialized sigma24 family protein